MIKWGKNGEGSSLWCMHGQFDGKIDKVKWKTFNIDFYSYKRIQQVLLYQSNYFLIKIKFRSYIRKFCFSVIRYWNFILIIQKFIEIIIITIYKEAIQKCCNFQIHGQTWNQLGFTIKFLFSTSTSAKIKYNFLHNQEFQKRDLWIFL